jgi:hypothetical protein
VFICVTTLGPRKTKISSHDPTFRWIGKSYVFICVTTARARKTKISSHDLFRPGGDLALQQGNIISHGPG